MATARIPIVQCATDAASPEACKRAALLTSASEKKRNTSATVAVITQIKRLRAQRLALLAFRSQ